MGFEEEYRAIPQAALEKLWALAATGVPPEEPEYRPDIGKEMIATLDRENPGWRTQERAGDDQMRAWIRYLSRADR